MYNASKLKSKLPSDKIYDFDKMEYVDFPLSHYAIVTDDGQLMMSAEHDMNCALVVADYYGEAHPKEWPWINPVLQDWAEKHNCYWDWQNPGTIILCED